MLRTDVADGVQYCAVVARPTLVHVGLFDIGVVFMLFLGTVVGAVFGLVFQLCRELCCFLVCFLSTHATHRINFLDFFRSRRSRSSRVVEVIVDP